MGIILYVTSYANIKFVSTYRFLGMILSNLFWGMFTGHIKPYACFWEILLMHLVF